MESILKLMDYLLKLEGDFENKREKQMKGFGMIIEDDRSELFIAEQDGEVVGMAGLHFYISSVQGGYAGVVEDVVVAKEHSGKGIGTKLLNHIDNFARDKGVERLQLMVADDNTSAKSVYNTHNWHETKYIGYVKYL